MQNDSLDGDRPEGAIQRWLVRTYESHDEWKKKARAIFYHSNGDSDLSRQRLAGVVRSYFVDQTLVTEDVEAWLGGTTVTTRHEPPKVSVSNAGYFDWLFVADYLLLSCASPAEEYQEENQSRENDYQQLIGSFNLRMQVVAARQVIRESPGMDDEKVLASVQEKHAKASLANIKEARRLEAKGGKVRIPVEPQRAANMPLYKSVYFSY
jgi:hypothetical protein